jgi:hypothetical protein
MKRIEKTGEFLVKCLTYPLRVTIGVCRCINKSTPDTLEDCLPYEIKKKEETDGSTETNDAR